jgi:hypothetical protein
MYASGEIVETNKENLDRLIAEAGDLIGIAPPEPTYSISYFTDKESKTEQIEATYSPRLNEFSSKTEQHEAVLFHESVHYLMHHRGLLLGPFIPKANLYDQLVDETVAENATSVRYGYFEHLHQEDPLEGYRNICRFSSEIKNIPHLSELQESIVSKINEMNLKSFKLVSKHRKVEDSFLSHRDPSTIRSEVITFQRGLSDNDKRVYLPDAIPQLAGWNATRIKNSGVSPKELVGWIDDAVKQKWPSYGIYFNDIIGEIHDRTPNAN